MNAIQQFKEEYLTTNIVDAIMLHAAYADAESSNDPRTKIGARVEHLNILDEPVGGKIFGGFMGINHLPEAYHNKEQAQRLHDKDFKHKKILHAEAYTIEHAKIAAEMFEYELSEHGLWVLDVPCNNCTDMILDESISRVVSHLPFVYQHTNATNNSLEGKMKRVEKMRANGVEFRFYPNKLDTTAYIDGQTYKL